MGFKQRSVVAVDQWWIHRPRLVSVHWRTELIKGMGLLFCYVATSMHLNTEKCEIIQLQSPWV